jgi:glucose-1-phosphate thymidylyltransferase
MKGIVLAGGTGSRLWPITKGVSKQLLPIYDKPMIYYPISTLMLAGIRELIIITTPQDKELYEKVLLDGKQFGIEIIYAVQPSPDGLAQALVIAEEFLAGDSCLMILGDNIFHGAGLGTNLQNHFGQVGAHVFTYSVSNPKDYGILSVNSDKKPVSIKEKPEKSESNLAVTGLYFFDKLAPKIASAVERSPRGELEITSVLQDYLDRDQLSYTHLSRGTAWLDTGNPSALHDASTFIRVVEQRTGLKIACLEEIAFENKWIDSNLLSNWVDSLGNNEYAKYVKALLD